MLQRLEVSLTVCEVPLQFDDEIPATVESQDVQPVQRVLESSLFRRHNEKVLPQDTWLLDDPLLKMDALM